MAVGLMLLLQGRPLPLPSAPPIPPDCAWPTPPAPPAPPPAQPKRRPSQRRASHVEGPRKLIFLDVDGVLHSAHGANTSFEPRCMAALGRIVRETGAQIVLSSSWRSWPEGTGVKAVNKALRRHRIPELVSQTPSSLSNRPQEMKQWLADNPVKRVTRWIALDDMDLTQELGWRLVKTHAVLGLSENDATYAIALLEWDGVSAQPVRPCSEDESSSYESSDEEDGQSLLSGQSWRGSLADDVASSCPEHYHGRISRRGSQASTYCSPRL